MKTTYISLILPLALLCLRSEAVIGITTPSSDWVPVLYLSDADPTGDQQTSGAGGTEADIVGNASYAALYKKYDGTDFAFRIRMGADSNPSGYDSATIIGIDVTGDGSLDYYIGAEIDGVGASNSKFDIGIYAFNGSALTPSETKMALAPSSAQLYGYEQTADNFNWSTVTSIDLADDPSVPADVDGIGNADYFLSFSVPFADLAAAMALEGVILSVDTPISFAAITSQNLNQINNDFNGVDGTDPNSTTPWTESGGVSETYTPESQSPVPEPATYALVFGCVTLGFVACRRRR